MKRLIFTFFLCWFVIPSAYGETISYTSASGIQYVGEIKNGVMHGQGTLTFVDGTKYVGGWKDGAMHGQGTYTLVNGGKYVGQHKAGKWHGQGTFTWPSGDQYVGEYKAAHQHGQGTYTWANGRTHVGRYKANKKHGHGVNTKSDGSKSVGEFRHDTFWQGTYYNASGEVTGKQSDGLPGPACDGNPPSVEGAGFAVSQHHVVTAAHVLYCCKKVMIRKLECSGRTRATVVATEQKSDLGLLRLDKPLKHYATLRSGKELQLGEAVLTYDRKPKVNGCPQYDVGQGNVTKLNWMPDDSRLMNHNAPIGAGSSGGPILDASGHIIGVTLAKRGAGTEAAAVKPHLLGAFLKSNNVEYNTALSTTKLSPSDIKKKSDKFTVIIDCIQ